jgi:hypothetical protein
MVAWLKSSEGIVTIGALAYALLTIAARYMPSTPFWDGVRSFATDYAQKNLKALPADVGARLESQDGALVIVLTVGGNEVRRVPTGLK